MSFSVLAIALGLLIPLVVVIAVVLVLRSSRRGDREPQYWQPPADGGTPPVEDGPPRAP